MNAFSFQSLLTSVEEIARTDSDSPLSSKTSSFYEKNNSFSSPSVNRKYLESQLFQDNCSSTTGSVSENSSFSNEWLLDIPVLSSSPSDLLDFEINYQLSKSLQNNQTQKLHTPQVQHPNILDISPYPSSSIQNAGFSGIALENNFQKRMPSPPFSRQPPRSTMPLMSSVGRIQPTPTFLPQHNNVINVAYEAKLKPVVNDVYVVQFKRMAKDYVLGVRVPQNIQVGDAVIVSSDRGEDLGFVSHITSVTQYMLEKFHTTTIPNFDITQYVGRILRVATPRESQMLGMKTHDEAEVLSYARHIAANVHHLHMNLYDAEYQFDRYKITIYYDAMRRVNFRDFVQDLSTTFNARVWMERVTRE